MLVFCWSFPTCNAQESPAVVSGRPPYLSIFGDVPGSHTGLVLTSLRKRLRKNLTVGGPFTVCSLPPFQVQGAIMVASCFQILVGFSGIIGFLMRFIGPLTIAPTITLVALPLFDSAGDKAGQHWGIAFM